MPAFGARWLSADAAAVFDALLVPELLSTFEAAFAAFALVFRPAIFITSRVSSCWFSLNIDATAPH
ncbi:hypothetical protein [Mycolicibacterium wolinskyi]|uniref:hypothetical protein n=1 Tax=Mycolicibacterium wolinskyi TaxID=59750 RepID=UPI003BAA5424